MAMVSQVLRDSPVVTRAMTTPSKPVISTTTDVNSSQTPKASSAHESTGNLDGSGSRFLIIAPFYGVLLLSFGTIIGVKHYLRHNARNRVGVTVDNRGPITRGTVQRARRRRRERKLMTVDEVTKQFPMMKYRSWASERARGGWPTPGGVSFPASRANSTRDTNGIVPNISVKDRDPTEQRRSSNVAASSIPATLSEREGNKDDEQTELETKQSANTGQSSGTQKTSRQVQQGAPNGNDSDEDTHRNAISPPDCPSTPGYTCVICMSTLEDDDDIRALICGHAFHAVCIDLWLTSHRACCPLCNTNYYTPKLKPNPDGAPGAATDPGLRDNNQLNLPGAMRTAWHRGSNPNSSRQGTLLIRVGGEPRSRHASHGQPQDWNQRDDAITSSPPV